MKKKDQETVTKNVQYNNYGQAGAMGEGAIAKKVTMTWNGNSHEIDMKALAVELSQLHEKLSDEAQDDEQREVAKKVSEAADEAKQGRVEKAFEYLSRAGAWALKVATDIGVPVAIKALQVAMGIAK